MSIHWDVIIVGAGPAGSTLGRALSERGLRVLILDKEIFPRYKACGGGLNVRAANMLDVDLSSVVEDTIYSARIAFRMGNPSTNWSDRPLTYMVSRESFDHLLLQHAIASGCAVREGEKVRGVRVRESDVAVRSDGGTYFGKVVVGADGAHGVVASSVGLMEDAFVAIAIESEIEVSASDLEDWRNVVLLDLGSIRGGLRLGFPQGTSPLHWGGRPVDAGERTEGLLPSVHRRMAVGYEAVPRPQETGASASRPEEGRRHSAPSGPAGGGRCRAGRPV